MNYRRQTNRLTSPPLPGRCGQGGGERGGGSGDSILGCEMVLERANIMLGAAIDAMDSIV